jgi:hypothetical protein
MSWRPNPFKIGRTYRIKQDFRSIQFTFVSGQIVRFKSEGYSRYDSATIYAFEDTITGENFQWWLSDNEDESRWEELFEPCE